MSHTFPSSEPPAMGGLNCSPWSALSARLAYDRTLAPDDAMRRIRDAFDVYDGRADGEGSSQ